MENKRIGECVAALRQAMGATQEELAGAVGVSAQAVSKWECGGLPDAALLPGIADFFGVPIDRLFGREGVGGNIAEALRLHFAGKDHAERMREGIRLCFELQKALGGGVMHTTTLTDIQAINSRGSQYSQMLYDSGFALMCLIKELPYFMLLPEPPEGWEKGICTVEQYAELFRALGEERTMEVLFFLLRRAKENPFTPKLLEKALGLTAEKASQALAVLERYELVDSAEAELDDATQTIYTVNPNPGLLAMLVITKEVLRRPNSFCYFTGNRDKAYFAAGEGFCR